MTRRPSRLLQVNLSLAALVSILSALELVGRAEQDSALLPRGVRAVWDMSKAESETTPTRERVCINVLWKWQPAEAASAQGVPGTPYPSSALPTEFRAPLTTNQHGDEYLIVGDVHRNADILNIDTCHGEPANRAFPIDCRTTLRIEMFAGTIAAPPCFREERPPVVSLLTFHVPRARSLWLGPAVCDDFQIRRHHQGFGIREATWKACRHLARPVRRVSRRKAI
jgi:hypothetical protein